MKRFILPLLLALALILAACAPSQASANSSQAVPQPASNSGSASLTRSDGQGSVTIDVTPLNLSNSSNELQFDVAMNTHSVNLSMNLATLATLTTNTGIIIQADSWNGPAGGGHHVDGQLSFPTLKDGKSILDGASRLTLTIINVDAPSRVFVWQLK